MTVDQLLQTAQDALLYLHNVNWLHVGVVFAILIFGGYGISIVFDLFKRHHNWEQNGKQWIFQAIAVATTFATTVIHFAPIVNQNVGLLTQIFGTFAVTILAYFRGAEKIAEFIVKTAASMKAIGINKIQIQVVRPQPATQVQEADRAWTGQE